MKNTNSKAHNEVSQVEVPVESMGGDAAVVVALLAALEGLVRPRQHGLEFSQHRVNPFE